MAFESDVQGPSRRQVLNGQPQAPGMQQPGDYLDSQPGSEMSADANQISIDLSDAESSRKEEDGGLERQSSWRAEEQANGCNLSQVNYRSLGGQAAISDLPRTGGLEQGVTSQAGVMGGATRQ